MRIVSHKNFFIIPVLLYITGYKNKEQNSDNTFFFLSYARSFLSMYQKMQKHTDRNCILIERRRKKSIIFSAIYIIIQNIVKDREGFTSYINKQYGAKLKKSTTIRKGSNFTWQSRFSSKCFSFIIYFHIIKGI